MNIFVNTFSIGNARPFASFHRRNSGCVLFRVAAATLMLLLPSSTTATLAAGRAVVLRNWLAEGPGANLVVAATAETLMPMADSLPSLEGAGARTATTSTCGPAPRAPICNYPKCTADGWVFWPLPPRTSCPLGNGHGLCDGGQPGPPGQTAAVPGQ